MPKEDGIEAKFVYVPPLSGVPAWQFNAQEVQPPAARVWQRLAGITPGDASRTNDLPPLISFFSGGWENQSVQPPTLRAWLRYAGLLDADASDINDQAPFQFFVQHGWPIQPPQPPHPRPERSAAVMPKEDAIQAPMIHFTAHGWPVQPPQPPQPKPWRGGAIALGDFGAYARLIRFFQFGFENQPPQPPHPNPERHAGAIMRGEDGTEAKFFVIPQLDGWEIQSWQPPHWPLPRLAGALMRGDDGIAVPLFYPFDRFEQQQDQMVRHVRPSFLQSDSLIPYPPFVPDLATWAFDTFEPIRRRPVVVAIEQEPSFVPLPRYIPFGYDHQETPFWRQRRVWLPQTDQQLIPALPRLIWGFEPTERFVARRGGRVFPDVARELIIPAQRLSWAWEVQGPMLRPRPRVVSLDRGQELNSKLPAACFVGWDAQAWQPPHPRRERYGALVRGIDGTEGRLIVPFRNGWDPVLFWPPHPRREKSGSVMIGDFSGAWGPFIYLVPSGAIASDFALYLATAWDIGMPP